MTVDITPTGKFYFQPVENGAERDNLLAKMGAKYGLPPFTEKEKESFRRVQSIGVPMSQLQGFLNLKEDEQKAYKSPTGIPMDSTHKELVDWIHESLEVNSKYKLAIKGDVDTKYPRVKFLFEGLRDIEFYKFWYITSQKTNR
jgi:hypothetical protein